MEPFIKMFPDGKMENYFDLNGEQGVIKSRYLKHVSFQKHNLVSEGMSEKFDLILCRNVMIYFDRVTQNRLIRQFIQHLDEQIEANLPEDHDH